MTAAVDNVFMYLWFSGDNLRFLDCCGRLNAMVTLSLLPVCPIFYLINVFLMTNLVLTKYEPVLNKYQQVKIKSWKLWRFTLKRYSSDVISTRKWSNTRTDCELVVDHSDWSTRIFHCSIFICVFCLNLISMRHIQ